MAYRFNIFKNALDAIRDLGELDARYTFQQVLSNGADIVNFYSPINIGDRRDYGGSLKFNCQGTASFPGNFQIAQNNVTVFRVSHPSALGAGIVGSASWSPFENLTYNLGKPENYWANGYLNKVYLNATAILDGVTAGHILFTGDLVPATDDAEYIGEIGTPFKAIKGLVIKDTTDGKHYKITVVNGVLTATALD